MKILELVTISVHVFFKSNFVDMPGNLLLSYKKCLNNENDVCMYVIYIFFVSGMYPFHNLYFEFSVSFPTKFKKVMKINIYFLSIVPIFYLFEVRN